MKKKGKCGIKYSLASASDGPCPYGWGPRWNWGATLKMEWLQIFHFNHWSWQLKHHHCIYEILVHQVFWHILALAYLVALQVLTENSLYRCRACRTPLCTEHAPTASKYCSMKMKTRGSQIVQSEAMASMRPMPRPHFVSQEPSVFEKSLPQLQIL